jgi:hypothetical protein
MAKLDGTNGLIQQYDYQVLTTAFSYTFAAGTQTLIINPAGTLATGTVTMPAAPADGMVITVESTQIITALTLSGNTGQSIVGVPATLFANQPLSYVYRLSNTTWYPFSVARSAVLQVVSGITSSSYTTASSSPTATGFGVSITPTSATSKILILLAGAMDTGVANNQAVVAVRRGATDLGNGSNNFSAANRMISGLAVIYLDSPATTSSTTYNIYFQAGSSSTITWYSGATLTLMEIAA